MIGSKYHSLFLILGFNDYMTTLVAPQTLPHPVTQTVGRILAPVLGRLPLAKAVRGNAHNDPRVEAEFLGEHFSSPPSL